MVLLFIVSAQLIMRPIEKANVALLSYGNIHNWVDYPAVVSTWDKVHNALTALRIHCAKDLSQGGVYVMLGTCLLNISSRSSTIPSSWSQSPLWVFSPLLASYQTNMNLPLASYGDKVLPQMVVYLYAAGAPFEEAVNRYMLTNRAIRPYNPLGLDGADLQADFVSANLTDNAYNSSGVLPDDAFHLLNSSWTSTTTNRENGHYEIPNSLAKETS